MQYNSLFWKAVALTIIILFIGINFIPITKGIWAEQQSLKCVKKDFTTSNPCGSTHVVDDDGGGDYIKIQDAINNASNGDIINVWDGIYYENITVNKSLKIIGNSSATTKIIGMGDNNSVVTIVSDEVELTGFEIRNGSFLGIEIVGSRKIVISGNNITNNRYGIWLLLCFESNIDGNSIVQNREEGISLSYSLNNQIFNNNFIENSFEGEIGHAWFWNSFFNKWSGNYWDDLGGNRLERIEGQISIFGISIPWVNFDWMPTSEPIEI